MQELIKVQVKDDRQLVSARDLYKGLELKKKFSAWNKTLKTLKKISIIRGNLKVTSL